VLNHESVTDDPNIDRHRAAVIGGGYSRSDVGLRTALVFRFGEIEKPIGDIHFLDWSVDNGGDSGEA
jgi:hypothetical protein